MLQKCYTDIIETSLLHDFAPTAITLLSGAQMLTSLSHNVANELSAYIQTTGKGRLYKDSTGSIELIDSLWQEYGDTHTDLHAINGLLHIKERINALYKKKSRHLPFVIVDWGCGSGHTLRQLCKWLKKQNITNIKLYGFANEMHPDWQSTPEEITLILDIAENFSKYFKGRAIDFIYSIAGLYYLFLPEFEKQKYNLVEYFYVNRFDNTVFKNFSHTEKYLEQLSLTMRGKGEILIDLPVHVIDINYHGLQMDNSHFLTVRNPAKYGEHAFVVLPLDRNLDCDQSFSRLIRP